MIHTCYDDAQYVNCFHYLWMRVNIVVSHNYIFVLQCRTYRRTMLSKDGQIKTTTRSKRTSSSIPAQQVRFQMSYFTELSSKCMLAAPLFFLFFCHCMTGLIYDFAQSM